MAALVGEGPQYFEYKVEGLNQTAFFDISEAACQPFGFYHGYRVSTPRGGATVIGVKDGSLWVHVDHEQGATILPGNYEQLLGKNHVYNVLLIILRPGRNTDRRSAKCIRSRESRRLSC